MTTLLPMLLVACIIEVPDNDTEEPQILVSAAGTTVSSDDPPPGGDFTCADVDKGPVEVSVVVSDAGGVAELYVHLIEGRIVEESVDVSPDEPDVTWEITIGDTPLSEGDDELVVTLVPPGEGLARSGVTATFSVTATDTTTAIETLATDVSGNDSITWPFLLPEAGVHPACE